MADDIVLTVQVRNRASGEFQRLDRQLDRLRRSVRQAGSASASSSQQFQRLGQSLEDVRTRMQQLHTTGRTTNRELTHMRGSLQLVGRELMSAARAGSITRDEYSRLRNQLDRTRITFDRLTQEVRLHGTTSRQTGQDLARLQMSQERLRLAWARSEQQAVRLRQNEDRLRLMHMRLSGATQSVTSDTAFMGGMFDRFRQKAIGSAVVLGAGLLPTIGALAPMVAGLGSIVGVAALAFSGLSKPTRMLGEDEKQFLKALKPVRQEFEGLQRAARKAVLPGLSKSFDDIGRAIKEMNPVIEIAGKAFTDLVDKIAKGIASDDFMGPFIENVKTGTDWVLRFAGSMGTFTKAFFEFGTKSGPALDAWQNLLGGFLDRGLPSMFKTMEQGIKGSSDFLNGLAFVINDSLLPSLGKISAAFMEAFGPLLKEMLIGAGSAFNALGTIFEGVMEAVEPLAHVAADAFRAWNEIMAIGAGVAASLAKSLGGALLTALLQVAGVDVSKLGDDFRGFSDWVSANEGKIRTAFSMMALSFIDFVGAGIAALPQLIGAFSMMTELILASFDGIISGAALAFGWVPGIGDKLIEANRRFDEFASGVRESLSDAQQKAEEFNKAFQPQAMRAKLVFDVDQARQNLESIKQKLQDPELTKERKAKLSADRAEAARRLAAAKAELEAFGSTTAKPKLSADPKLFWGAFDRVKAAKIPGKSGSIGANSSGFYNAVSAIRSMPMPSKTVYINIRRTITEFVNKVNLFSANGNIFFADGGTRENHEAQIAPAGSMRIFAGPETQGEAYIPFAPTKRKRSRRIAEKTVDRLGGAVQWFARGGLSDSAREARNKLADEAQTSHFGVMAKYRFSPMEKNLSRAPDLGTLVSALNQMRGDIKRAFSGGTESRLLKQLNSAGNALIKYQKQLSAVNKALESAKTKLNGLKEAASQMADSVKSGILSGANITKGAQKSEGQVTINTLLSQMTADAANTKQLDEMLKKLQAKGLDKGLIEEIAQAGVEGGGLETAAAILGGGDAEIKRLTELRHQIVNSAKSIGSTAADAMYGAGIRSAQGLVDGLEKQKDKIEEQMLKIALAMEKAIKKALGIKSPSKVMEKVGDFTAQGFALGLQKNRKVSMAWESMLTTPRSAAPAGGAGGMAGGRPIVLNVHLGTKEFGQIWVDVGRKQVATRGGVQATLGRL